MVNKCTYLPVVPIDEILHSSFKMSASLFNTATFADTSVEAAQ